jgi:hypothetical protein
MTNERSYCMFCGLIQLAQPASGCCAARRRTSGRSGRQSGKVAQRNTAGRCVGTGGRDGDAGGPR